MLAIAMCRIFVARVKVSKTTDLINDRFLYTHNVRTWVPPYDMGKKALLLFYANRYNVS